MALIPCSKCGKEISDKATMCPNCGEPLLLDTSIQKLESPAIVICEECGTEFSMDADTCPNCGCPNSMTDNAVEPEPQKIEMPAEKSQQKSSTKKYAIIAVIAIMIVALISIGISKQQTTANYEKNLELASETMIYGAGQAEDAANLIRSVWYNSIYEEYDSKTDKYTRPNGYFYDDFNDAIIELFSDSGFQLKLSIIEDNQDEVASIMKKLKNPPKGYEDAYAAICEYYDVYLDLTNLAVNPQGNLQSYTSNYIAADFEVFDCYEVMEIYLD